MIQEVTEFILKHTFHQGPMHAYCSCGRWFVNDIFNETQEHAEHLAREITRTYRIES